MNKESLWEDTVRRLTAFKLMENYDQNNEKARKDTRRIKRKADLKENLVKNAKALYDNNFITEELKSYEEIIQSVELHKWLVENAPKGFKFGQSDIFSDRNTLKYKIESQREYKLYRHNVDDKFMQNYMRSSGYESADEVSEKDIKAIAKRNNISFCVAEEKVKDYFVSSKRKEKLLRMAKKERTR